MSSEPVTPIGVVNPETVLSAFGSWPSFHDAEVHRVVLDRGSADDPPTITLAIHAFVSDGSIGENGYYRIATGVLVTLRCLDVSESELRDFGCQNVLSSLEFESEVGGLVRVTLGPCYGLSGTVLCKEVRVASVVPWPPPTGDAQPANRE